MTPACRKKHVPAGRFKAECLALLDEVAETRESLVVTQHGRPVAEEVSDVPRAPVARGWAS